MIHVEQTIADARKAVEEGRLDDAEGELRAVLEFDDFEPRALRLMGKVASRRGDAQRAADYYQQALKARDPEQAARAKGPTPTPTLAELYAEQGHTQAAAEVYRHLLAADPADARTDDWRRRLAVLTHGEAAEPGVAGGGAAAGAAGPGADAVPAGLVEQRLRAFLELLDGDRESARLRRFLERLEARHAR